VRETLKEAVRIRLRADVPLAIELSGGMDSSTILALAAQVHPSRLTTYTVAYPDPRWNEEPFARSIAQRYDTDYRVIEPGLDGFWENISAFTALQEEPYHSPNLRVNQTIWSAMRDQGTKVSLTGAAGDELFAGYSGYYWKAQLDNVRNGNYRYFVDNARHWTEGGFSVAALARELVGTMGLRNVARGFRKILMPKVDIDYQRNVPEPSRQYFGRSLTECLYSDITNTLIPYWLRSGEKTYMGVPFEARSPFLDYKVVEVAAQLPTTYLIRHGWHKWILRKAMENDLPETVLWRKRKMGFPYPYERFFEKYRPVVELILREARNPFVDCSRPSVLLNNWKAISFILWYEYFINENKSLFRRIEELVSRASDSSVAKGYVPAFLSSSSLL
jgi:asparagine synthase (glutamine-hydrolysing)